MTSFAVRDADRLDADRLHRGLHRLQDHHQGEDRLQGRHQGEDHQELHRGEDQNQDVHQDRHQGAVHQDHRGEDHRGQDAYRDVVHLVLQGAVHQDQDAYQDECQVRLVHHHHQVVAEWDAQMATIVPEAAAESDDQMVMRGVVAERYGQLAQTLGAVAPERVLALVYRRLVGHLRSLVTHHASSLVVVPRSLAQMISVALLVHCLAEPLRHGQQVQPVRRLELAVQQVRLVQKRQPAVRQQVRALAPLVQVPVLGCLLEQCRAQLCRGRQSLERRLSLLLPLSLLRLSSQLVF